MFDTDGRVSLTFSKCGENLQCFLTALYYFISVTTSWVNRLISDQFFALISVFSTNQDPPQATTFGMAK